VAKSSFDIVSDYDKSEMNNVYDQAQRELANRYDLKNSKTSIEWLSGHKDGITIKGENEFQVDAALDIYRKKLAQRGLSQKILDTSQPAAANGLIIVKKIVFKKGLKPDDIKTITKLLKAEAPKLNLQVQGEEIRVISSKKDELQAAIALLKQTDFDFPLSFTNYR
jgi:uncharacterized protein YajQ (UPF0234 family)